MKEITKKFNLPKYIHGKSFAEASKLIEKKFKGRSDKEAMDTKNDLMSRLRDAQEYVKEIQAYKESPDSQPQGPTHTMPDGTEMAGEQHQYMYGGYKKKTNDYSHGGPHNVMPPADDFNEFIQRASRGKVEPLNTGNLPTYEVSFPYQANPQIALEGDSTPSLDGSDPAKYEIPRTEGLESDISTRGRVELENNNGTPALTPEMVMNMSESKDKKEKKGINKDKIKDALIAAGQLAPSAMNLAQLASLKKSDQYRSGRMNSTYDKQITDEAAMMNAMQVENAGQRNAMRSNSGSQSMLLNNLRGQSLNALKGQSDAYMKSVANNQEENRRENAFNTSKEQFNISAQNSDDIINQQNEAAYQSTSSSLKAGLANDIGKMSKEALFKKYPELMGMDYDWLGKKVSKKKKK